MKKFIVLALLACAFRTEAQQDVFELMERTDLNIQEIETRANRYFEIMGTGRGTGYKQFQRWLYERKFHVDENGFYISPKTEWENYLAARNAPGMRTTAGNWVPLGPNGWTYTSGWNPGTGRLSAMAIHPANPNVIYVGSPGGGLWKSTNAGSSWSPLTDNDATWMFIYSITIDPNDQNIIYIGTNNGLVLKSTDAGMTFAPAGGGPSGTIRKILIHPSNSNIVFATATNGIWRSTNAGSSWTQAHTTSTEDIEFKPDDMNIMYASGSGVWRSVNNGQTWTTLTSAQGITNSGRTLVAVSAADPNIVYAAQASGSSFGRMYRSTDAGLNFVTTVVGSPAAGTNYFGYEASGTGTGGQATYDMALDVSPTNANEIHIAGIIVWRSTDGATSFTAQTVWSYPNSTGYNHADVHGLFWIGGILYSISDGGLYKTSDNGDNWTDLSPGLGIRQFYRIATSPTNADVITGGAQDNGTVTRQSGGNWVDWLGADGMEGLVSPTNHLRIWGTSQNGSLYRSTNGGNSYSSLGRPNAGNWVTPLAIHPTNETILYGGWTGVFKSTNSGTNWTNIGSAVMNVLIEDIAVAPSNPNYIYASDGSTLFVTTNDGTDWAIRSCPAVINDIAIDPTNPDKVWVALQSSTNRVMVSTNAGQTWTNVSTGLPAIAARTIVVDDNSPRGLYVGMNVGVFYKLETDPNWTDYSTNLPMVAINELEIHKASGKIRVATYGRSVWESPVANGCAVSTPAANFSANATSICVGQAVVFNNTSTDCQSTFAWTFPGGSPGSSTAQHPTVTYNTPGTYSVTLTVTNPGGSDTRTNTNYITVGDNLVHSASISTTNSSICQGQSATFTLTNANQGASPVIDWLKNGIAIPGTTGLTTVVLTGLVNGDVISARETSSLTCSSPNTITTNAVTMTVTPNVTHTASISTPKSQLCTGESATFTLTNANPGSSPVINWYRNSVLIPGTTGLTSITINNPANGDVVSVTETSNATCVSPATINTNAITLSVTPMPPKPVITQVAGDLTSSAGTGNQWYLNGTAITGATNQTFHPTINGTYTVQVTINGCQSPMSDARNMIIEGVNLLYPVPSNGNLTFDFYIPVGSAKYKTEVFNAAGQLVYMEEKTGQPGLNRNFYNWERFAAGIYQLRMTVGSVTYKKRFVID